MKGIPQGRLSNAILVSVIKFFKGVFVFVFTPVYKQDAYYSRRYEILKYD